MSSIFTIILLFPFAIVCTVRSETKRYDHYCLIQAIPTTRTQLIALKSLLNDIRGNLTFDYWKRPTDIEKPVEIMIEPDKKQQLIDSITSLSITPTVLINNIQEKIDNEVRRVYTRRNFISMNFQGYFSLQDIYDWVDDLASQHPKKVKVTSIGKTIENRPIKLVVLTFGEPKAVAVLECGAHAREWISPSFCTYVISELLTNKTENHTESDLESLQWHIIPVLNPDGYNYSFEKDRLWRKNRNGQGVDLDRNFEFRWGDLSSNDTESPEYHGKGPFSELETRALRDHLKKISKNVMFYISIHAYGQKFLVPYGTTDEHFDNYNETIDVANRVINAIQAFSGQRYKACSVGELFDLMSGLSIDWVKSTLGVPFVYAFEMRDEGKDGFLLPSEQILPNHKENMLALKTIISEQKLGLRERKFTSRRSATGKITHCFIMYVITFMILFSF